MKIAHQASVGDCSCLKFCFLPPAHHKNDLQVQIVRIMQAILHTPMIAGPYETVTQHSAESWDLASCWSTKSAQPAIPK